jgi:hypothetical protein
MEGRWWLVVDETSPPLTFEVTEGLVVASITQKRTTEPPAHVFNEGGGGGGVVVIIA